ncbi:hypothetical protein [Maridesulfovibrio sp. FT414]|uniref:hypothetical protein n=1 Tax=Maridesulfovibrio sp. FT414 TaxID=2979469 RepID=UPI003D807D3D
MIFSLDIKKIGVVVFALFVICSALPANAAKVQIFDPVDPAKEIAPRALRDEAVTQAFAQALFADSVRMMSGELSPERSEALKWMFGKHYEDYILGYKDMNVKQDETGVSVSIDVNVNRKFLRDKLNRMGLLAAGSGVVEAEIIVANGKFALNEEQQASQEADIATLMSLYGVHNATAGTTGDDAASFAVTRVAKNRWSGELKSGEHKWFGSAADLEGVWSQLWEKYYAQHNAGLQASPKAVLVVSGWFNPDGVLEFERKLKSWDSAVQDVLLLDVEMKPTAVSASWALDVSDQWVLRSYLNDYLPPRGLSFDLKGLKLE